LQTKILSEARRLNAFFGMSLLIVLTLAVIIFVQYFLHKQFNTLLLFLTFDAFIIFFFLMCAVYLGATVNEIQLEHIKILNQVHWMLQHATFTGAQIQNPKLPDYIKNLAYYLEKCDIHIKILGFTTTFGFFKTLVVSGVSLLATIIGRYI